MQRKFEITTACKMKLQQNKGKKPSLLHVDIQIIGDKKILPTYQDAEGLPNKNGLKVLFNGFCLGLVNAIIWSEANQWGDRQQWRAYIDEQLDRALAHRTELTKGEF